MCFKISDGPNKWRNTTVFKVVQKINTDAGVRFTSPIRHCKSDYVIGEVLRADGVDFLSHSTRSTRAGIYVCKSLAAVRNYIRRNLSNYGALAILECSVDPRDFLYKSNGDERDYRGCATYK